jgi:hypothetical protein
MEKKLVLLVGIILLLIVSFVNVNIAYGNPPTHIKGTTTYNPVNKFIQCECYKTPHSCYCGFMRVL